MNKKMHRLLILLLALLLLLNLAACNLSSKVVSSVIFPKEFFIISGQTPEGWKESLESAGPGQYVRIQAQNDRVVMELNDSQQEFWLQKFEDRITDLSQSLATLDPGYRIQCAEDYSRIDFYYNPDLAVTQAIYHVVGTETYCICMQLLQGADADAWSVTMNLYNSDTGKLVATGDDKDGITYTKEDWEASK